MWKKYDENYIGYAKVKAIVNKENLII